MPCTCEEICYRSWSNSEKTRKVSEKEWCCTVAVVTWCSFFHVVSSWHIDVEKHTNRFWMTKTKQSLKFTDGKVLQKYDKSSYVLHLSLRDSQGQSRNQISRMNLDSVLLNSDSYKLHVPEKKYRRGDLVPFHVLAKDETEQGWAGPFCFAFLIAKSFSVKLQKSTSKD